MLDPTVDFLASLAGEGPVLEFAIGMGRLAVSLARRGIPVNGIEISSPMVDQLRIKATPEEIPVATAMWPPRRSTGSSRSCSGV